VAPSFPAEFCEIKDYKTVVGMIRALGFKYVAEVSFGADLVAEKFRDSEDNSQYYISSIAFNSQLCKVLSPWYSR